MHKIFNQLEEYKVAIIGDVHLRLDNPRCRTDNYLQSILLKLEDILINNDIVICLGDLFDKPSVGEECIHSFLELLSKYNKPFYTIWGNHDLFKYNIDKLTKTSLGICILENKVKHLNLIQVHNIKFKEIPFVKKFPTLPNHDENTILLGHYFYESEISPNYSLNFKQIEDCKAKYIFLGHEHAPFPNLTINNTTIIRKGSICRNTINAYNHRIPEYTQLIISKDTFLIKYQHINIAKNFSDIFIQNLDLAKKILKSNTEITNSLSILDTEKLNKVESIEEIFLQINASTNHIEYLTKLKENLK